MIAKGQRISDRYLILRSIGEGGMANVYLAHDTILDRDVAVKVLRGDMSNDEKFVRRFQREALAASSLTHPNIVEMYDVGEDKGNYFIVMEYVEGKTLKQLIKKRGTLTLSEAIDIMLQITDGISSAHDAYIIHRDIKPQNIMIKDDGQVKITDFGIAMALNSTQLTQTNSVMGSVHYLPPEQALGKGATIRSDIYSMGIMFYEILTGKLPFKGENAVEIAMKQIKDDLPSVRDQNSAVPQSVENIIIKATAKNPKNRYHDAKEMHEDLLTCLDEERLNEPRVEFQYPEHEEDPKKEEIKNVPKVERKGINRDYKEETGENEVKLPKEKEDSNEIVSTKVEEDDLLIDDKEGMSFGTKVAIILGVVLFLIIIVFGLIVIVLPEITKVPDIEIPSVAGESVVDASGKLQAAGFEVNAETIKETSEEVDSGKVIRTEPTAGRKVKKGTKITLVESSGNYALIVEDYTDQNVYYIQGLLEASEIKVNIEKKDIDSSEKDKYEENKIMDQSVKVGEQLKAGDSITLYIPDIQETYPDFVEEAWSVEDVQTFCDEHNITLKIDKEENGDKAPGTILEQSRKAGSEVVSGSNLKIVVAEEPSNTPGEGEPEEGSTNITDDTNE